MVCASLWQNERYPCYELPFGAAYREPSNIVELGTAGDLGLKDWGLEVINDIFWWLLNI